MGDPSQPQVRQLGHYGVGLECSIELATRPDVEELFTQVGSFEIIPESYFYGRHADFIKTLGVSQVPVVGHCVDLSIGTDEPLDLEHLDRALAVLSELNCVVFSDHICMTTAGGIDIGQLTTLPFTQKVVDAICRKTEIIQKRITTPFMLENITNRFLVPGCELSETQFINQITRRSGCGLLLDVTNLYINSVNHRFDPYAWFDEIDQASVMGIHLAGGVKEGSVLYDTHSRAVPRPVWKLLAYVLERASPGVIIVEWDQDMPSTERLVKEVRRAEEIALQADAVKAARQHGVPLAGQFAGEPSSGRPTAISSTARSSTAISSTAAEVSL